MGGRFPRACAPGVKHCLKSIKLHRQLLANILVIGTSYPLVITGGYALQAHGLVDRQGQASPAPEHLGHSPTAAPPSRLLLCWKACFLSG